MNSLAQTLQRDMISRGGATPEQRGASDDTGTRTYAFESASVTPVSRRSDTLMHRHPSIL